MTDRDDAVTALKRLGLSSYEAQVFVALQRVGQGSARDVDRITDVPRSQVYGAAESLEERGLIDVQQSEPIQYRAVGLDEARGRLRARLDDAENRAFSYLEATRHELGGDERAKEDIWTVDGTETITDRIVGLADEAEERVVFATDDVSLMTPPLVAALSAVARDVTVVVMSVTPAVREHFDGTAVLTPVINPAIEMGPHDWSGRILIVDADTVLLSVVSEGCSPGSETAIWSANTGFASVFVGLFEGRVGEFLDD